ncbi:MAG: hypothetical protein ABJA67_05180 [Chthonomonadales bacterium]
MKTSMISFLCLLLLSSGIAFKLSDPLRLIQTISLTGVEGRIDHLAYDAVHGRLFVAALGNNTVEVVDVKSGERIRSIKGFREPQGIAYLPKVNQICVASGQGTGIDFLDGTSYNILHSVPLGDDSDNVRYEAGTNEIAVGFGSGKLAFIEPVSRTVLWKIDLAGHPESFQMEGTGSRTFVNVPTAGHIAVVDRKLRSIVSTWPIVAVKSNFPMALDESSHRLFVGCRNPAKTLVYDTLTGKVVANLYIVGDTDDLFYDEQRKRLYISGGAGFVDVFQKKEGDQFDRISHLQTATGARTSLFVAKTRRLYLAIPHRGDQKAEIRVYELQD